jgi:uncharacterized phage protein (TIGR02218 family)
MSGSSYDLAEIGTYTGQEVRLYRFQRGGASWFFNTGDRNVVWDGATWLATSIQDDGLKQKGEATSDDFIITVPSGLTIVQMFRGTPPSDPIKVTVRQLQYGDDVAPLVWVGYVASVKYHDEVTSDIVANTQTAYLNKKGLRLSWTRGCPYALYDRDCGVDHCDWAEPVQLTGIHGNGFHWQHIGYFNPKIWNGRFTNGYVEWRPSANYFERRAILVDLNSNTGTDNGDVLIIGQTDGMVENMDAVLYPGCTRDPAGCKRFNNLPRNGGFGFMSGKSPFDGARIF